MLSREAINGLAVEMLKNEGLQILHAMIENERRTKGMGPANLVALMGLFAERLEAAQHTDTVAVIDAAMGAGWTRRLAEALGERPREGNAS